MTPSDDKKGGWPSRSWTPQGERLFVGLSGQGSSSRSGATLSADEGQSLERELLLAEGVADPRESPRPASSRRPRWIVSVTAVLIVLAVSSAWVVRERNAREEERIGLEGRIATITADSAQKLDALRKENAQKDQAIADRKSENQNLAGLMQKTLGQLQASLEDLRHEREKNEKLGEDLRKALEAPPKSTLAETLSTWLPRWVRAAEEKERAGGPTIVPTTE